MKFNWKIPAIIALALGLVVGVPVAAHYRAKGELESYRQQLTARGEKLAIEEIAPPSKAGERTAALDFMQAVRALGSAPTNSPPMMRKLAPGRALVATAEKELPTSESSNIWAAISPQLLARDEALASLRAALQTPSMDFGLDFTQGFSLLLPHLAPAKAAAVWLAAAAMSELHAGHNTNALADLQSLVALSHPLEHEPLMISQLVRMAIEHIAISATWEALQTTGWHDKDLAELQTAWNSIDMLEGIEPASEMERAFTPIEFAEARKSFNTASGYGGGNGSSASDTLAQALANPKDGLEAFSAYQRYWMWKWQWVLRRRALLYASLSRPVWKPDVPCETTRPSSLNFKSWKTVSPNFTASIPRLKSRFLFGFSNSDSLIERFLVKFADIQMEQRLVITAIALKRYQLRQGKYPARLQDLTPDYLPETPSTPWMANPCVTNPNPATPSSSIPWAKTARTTAATPTRRPKKPSKLKVYKLQPWLSEGTNQLWLKARDAVWPMPATAEEVQAYKDKSLADWSELRGHRRLIPPALPRPARTNSPATNKN